MKFPAMNKQSRRGVNIPEFAGGLNLRDNPVQVNDNQLTDIKNMWYKDGALRTRPRIFTENELPEAMNDGKMISCNSVDLKDYEWSETRYFSDITYLDEYMLEVTQFCKDETLYFIFNWVKEDATIYLQNFFIEGEDKYKNYFAVEKDGIIYCFLETGVVYKRKFKDPDSDPDWGTVSDEEFYVPLVAMNCVSDGSLSMTPAEVFASGTMLEGYNLLSNYYKISYNAYNKNIEETKKTYDDDGETVISTKTGVYMRYSLPEHIWQDKYLGKKVTAEYTKNGITYTHEITVQKIENENGELLWGWIEEAGYGEDGLKMRVASQMVFFEDKETENNAFISEKGNTDNNLELIAPYIPDNREEELERIFGMTRCAWFGGEASGLAGGTRLFLCGNKNKNKSALVCWSGLNNPLYFPENSYFYVGNTAETVTGFGKQSDMLVIFKKNETWYTQYRQNTDITGSDLINKTVVDIQSSSVYFPLTQINANIGCAYPDTIQLCRNRLVFVGSDRRVYTLVSNSQYNERSIFCVSEMMDKTLRKESISGACDWNGYYCLSCGNKIYLMDYNCYGYQYISSYSKTEDANKHIPWYLWETSIEKDPVITNLGDSLILTEVVDEYIVRYKINAISESGYTDDMVVFENSEGTVEIGSKKIKSMLQTKFFDFGAPNTYKNIDSVGLSLGYNGGEEITVTLLTDGGEEQIGVVLENAAEERSAGFTNSRILYPAIRYIIRLGAKLECEGSLIVDGMTLEYRITGRAR